MANMFTEQYSYLRFGLPAGAGCCIATHDQYLCELGVHAADVLLEGYKASTTQSPGEPQSESVHLALRALAWVVGAGISPAESDHGRILGACDGCGGVCLNSRFSAHEVLALLSGPTIEARETVLNSMLVNRQGPVLGPNDLTAHDVLLAYPALVSMMVQVVDDLHADGDGDFNWGDCEHADGEQGHWEDDELWHPAELQHRIMRLRTEVENIVCVLAVIAS